MEGWKENWIGPENWECAECLWVNEEECFWKLGAELECKGGSVQCSGCANDDAWV